MKKLSIGEDKSFLNDKNINRRRQVLDEIFVRKTVDESFLMDEMMNGRRHGRQDRRDKRWSFVCHFDLD